MRCSIFDIVALVHTAPYVDLYHHYRRRTLAKVPRQSSIRPPLFHKLGALYDMRLLPSSTHHGRCRPGPLPPPMAAICPFRRNARVPPIMGDDGCSRLVVIRAGRGKNTVLLPGRFEGFSLRHNNQTARASTAANGWNMPVLAQRARSPHYW